MHAKTVVVIQSHQIRHIRIGVVVVRAGSGRQQSQVETVDVNNGSSSMEAAGIADENHVVKVNERGRYVTCRSGDEFGRPW